MVFKLAHLSDPHLGPLPDVRRRELISKRITGYVNWQRNRAKSMNDDTLSALVAHLHAAKPDHIAATGDLVNLALPAEFTLARQWLETLGSGDDVSVVPGNHDTYVPGALAQAQEIWAPYMTGDGERDVAFPYLRIRDGVALMGANSGRATLPFLATGSFREPQARRLAELLEASGEAGHFRVVMIHHPPHKNATARQKRLIGSSRFRAVIAKHGCELVLHGHTHLPTRVEIQGPRGSAVPVFGVSAAGQSPYSIVGKRPKPPASYNLFEIKRQSNGWQCLRSRYGFEPNGNDVVQLSPSAPII
ncbi:metallophosphoesterase family protein [Pseudahrensia aquimaris]|uniref:Metallophosphoesterase family protein n=1 Tax=Pseudahrensia aquimaris TaxID=744461 RepID=A0ABW3FBF5_9HYPH